MTETVRVAIACQGGGAQTAFTAGVLEALLDNGRRAALEREYGVAFEIVGLSGTSGGAVCAALTWADLMLGREARKLKEFWTTGYPDGNAALPYGEAWAKTLTDAFKRDRVPGLPVLDRLRADLGMAMLEEGEHRSPFPIHYMPKQNPYYFQNVFELFDLVTTGPIRFGAEHTRAMIKAMLTSLDPQRYGKDIAAAVDDLISTAPIFHDSPLRREFDVQEAFVAMLEHYFPADDRRQIAEAIEAARKARREFPELLIGTADVLHVHEDPDDIDLQPSDDVFIDEEDARKARENNFKVFRGSDPETLKQLPRAIAASAAIPEIMRAVELDGTAYWDALYSSNPPLYDLAFLHGHKHDPNSRADRNPEEIWLIRINPTNRDAVPKTFRDIDDRRNELAGNLSTFHEIRLVRKVDALTTRCAGSAAHERIAFGFIDMTPEFARELDYPSKLDRREGSLEALYKHGTERGEAFLRRWAKAEEGWYKTHPDQPAPAKAEAG
jgi:predicted acylesterase/phospholipase RssA